MSESMTLEELHVLEHTTGWNARRRKDRLCRNHFCAGPDHDEMPIIQNLRERGLMKMHTGAEQITGGDSVFYVTEAGIELLKRWRP